MDNDKSILEKITDKVKNIANIAADAANEAFRSEAPPPKVDEYSAANTPLAADGLVSDPVMVPPVAVAPARKSKRAALKRAIKKLSRKTANGEKTPQKGSEPIGLEAIKESTRKENQQENGEEGSEEGAKTNACLEIRKSGDRFSEKIMLKQRDEVMIRFNLIGS